MSGSINLGNVAGVVRSASPPLEEDGLTVKTYVLWAKVTSTSPLIYTLFYYDSVIQAWESLDKLRKEIMNLSSILIIEGVEYRYVNRTSLGTSAVPARYDEALGGVSASVDEDGNDIILYSNLLYNSGDPSVRDSWWVTLEKEL